MHTSQDPCCTNINYVTKRNCDNMTVMMTGSITAKNDVIQDSLQIKDNNRGYHIKQLTGKPLENFRDSLST